MVQASVQFYPGLVKKHEKIQTSITFILLKVRNWKKSWVCGNYLSVFLQKKNSLSRKGIGDMGEKPELSQVGPVSPTSGVV